MIATALTIAASTMATLIWRIIGVGIAGRIDTEHPLYEWFSHVSYASVAAILMQNLFSSNGSLTTEELIVRAISVLCGILACRMRAEKVFLGLIVSLLVYVSLDYSNIIQF